MPRSAAPGLPQRVGHECILGGLCGSGDEAMCHLGANSCKYGFCYTGKCGRFALARTFLLHMWGLSGDTHALPYLWPAARLQMRLP